jgi:MFS superfamily sulfate permease-like transporter
MAMDLNPAPPPMTPLPESRQRIDLDHLKALGFGHLAVAALALLGVVPLLLLYAWMRWMFPDWPVWHDWAHAQPNDKQSYLICLSLFLFFAAVLVLDTLSGIFILKKKFRLFSLLVAVINCLNVPIGTVLGILTLIVLSRKSVRELYG